MKIGCSWMNFIHDDVGNGDGDVIHDIGGLVKIPCALSLDVQLSPYLPCH